MADDGVREYIDGIAAEHRPSFDRLQRLILEAQPDAAVSLSYRIPTYTFEKLRLHVGVWKHGLSIYGLHPDRDDGFSARHPELRTSKGTFQLRPDDLAAISDEEWSGVLRAALAG